MLDREVMILSWGEGFLGVSFSFWLYFGWFIGVWKRKNELVFNILKFEIFLLKKKNLDFWFFWKKFVGCDSY